MNHNIRRVKQSTIIGALIGVGLWALLLIAALGSEHFPNDIYLFGLISFVLFVFTTAILSLMAFYVIPIYLVYFTQKYIAAKEYNSMQDTYEERHPSIKLRYRLFAGLIFALAAAIALPVLNVVIAVFTEGSIASVKSNLGSFLFGTTFSYAAFLWGTLLASRYRVSDNKNAFFFITITFLWGCVTTALTIFSTGFIIGLFESVKHMEVSVKAFEYGLFILGFGSVFTFGILYVVGGIAGVITGVIYRRIPHNTTLQPTSTLSRRLV